MDKYKIYPGLVIKKHQANIFLTSTNYPHMRFSRDTLKTQKKNEGN